MALFTPENAVIAQAKGVIARKHNQELRKSELEQAVKHALFTEPVTDDSYISLRLVDVREDISEVRAKLRENLDEPQAVDRYASAIAKLSEIERQLAGRPMPGSLKPSQPKARSRPVQAEPIGTVPKPEPEQGPA